MSEKFDPDKYLAETELEFDPDQYLAETEEPVSQLESAARGAAQGLTFEMADELLGAGKAAYDIATDKPELKDFAELYKKYRDIEREKFTKAKEANPITYGASDIGAGILPALLSGGATAAANIGKVGLKEAAKAAAKTGAKFGGATALGMTEDITDVGQAAKDVAMGAGLGAATGVAIPAAGKALGRGASKVAEGVKDLADKFPTISKPFEFAAKYGMTNTSKRAKILQKDVENLLDSFKNKFQKLGLEKEAAEAEAKAIQNTYNAAGDLQAIADKFRTEAKYLSGSAKTQAEKMAKEVESLFKQEQMLAKDLQKELEQEISKKLEKSQNKDIASQKKAESKAVLEAEKKGLELEQIENLNKNFEDVAELPFDTVGGKLKGGKATFRDRFIDPETGEEVSDFFQKKYVEDVTPFQPSPIGIAKQGDELVGAYMNEATGEIFRKYKNIPKQDIDFSKMSVDDMLNWLKATQRKAFEEGGADADMYKELWKVARNNVPKMIEGLPQNKQEYSKTFAILDILGIDKDVVQKGQYMPQDIVDLMKKLPRKMGTEKEFIEQNLLKQGDDIGKRLKDVELTSEVDRILEGSTSATGEFTKAGIAQKATGVGSELLGTAYGKTIKPIVTASGKAVKALNKMSDSSLNVIKDGFLNSENKGLQAIGNNIQNAMQAEGPLKNALLWSISQQPAVRQAIENELNEEETPSFEETTQLENTREPQSVGLSEQNKQRTVPLDVKETLQYEGQGDKTGADDSTGYMGVTDNARMSVGRLEEYRNAKTNQERRQIDEQVAKEYYDQLQKIMPEHWKNIPNEYKPIFLDTIYNTGPSLFNENKAPNLNSALKRGDYLEAARQTLDTANTGGKTSKGIAKRRAEQYNKLANMLNSPTIDQVEQTPSGEIIYRSGDNEILKYGKKKGAHESSVPGILQIKDTLNKIMKMKSSGMETPEYEIEKAFDGINQMDIPEEDKLALQDEVVQIESFSDVERIKQLLDKYRTS